MDLIDRKRIINGLPKYDEGLSDKQKYYPTYDQMNDPLYYAAKIPIPEPKLREPSLTVNVPKYKKPGPNLGNIANIAGAGIQGLVSTIGDFNSYGYDKSVQDLNNQAGTNQETTNGITYTTQNFIGNDELRNAESEANGKILGSMGTGAAAGASIGSVIPGVGTAIGGAVGAVGGLISGIFGSKKAKREARRRIEEQRQRAAIQNDFARGVATTKGLNLDYIREHGNTETQSLYKDGKQPVYSPFGPINAEADSKVSKGEVAIDTQTGSRYRIPTGPNDTALFAGGKNPNTAIITNKYGLSDIAMENPELAIQLQKEMKDRGMLKKTKGEYKCGKMPKYKYGHYIPTEDPDVLGTTYELPEFTTVTKRRKQKSLFQAPNVEPNFRAPSLEVPIPWEDPLGGKQIDPSILSINIPEYKAPKPKSPSPKKGPMDYLKGFKNMFDKADPNQVANAAIHGVGSLVGLSQYNRAKNSTPYKPNTYAANPYESKGLEQLAGLDINAYPIMRKLDQQRAWTDYMLNNSGGLSGAQKYLGRIANSRNTQSSIADMLSNIGLQRNQLRANYANALLTTGAQEAQNRMAANKYDIDMFMRSHAARQQGMDTGIYNMLNNAQSYLANKFKYDQFLKTYGLYSTDLNNKRV